MSVEAVTHAVNVRLGDDKNSVVILDQTLLPNETKYLTLRTAEELWQAIYLLQVRGAPAIGIFAAYSMAVLAKNIEIADYDGFCAEYFRLSAYLNSSRIIGIVTRRLIGYGIEDSTLNGKGRVVNSICYNACYLIVIEHKRSGRIDLAVCINNYQLYLCASGVLVWTVTDVVCVLSVFDNKHSGVSET